MKATTTSMMIGALGLGLAKGMDKCFQKILGHTKIQELQKITLLGTSHKCYSHVTYTFLTNKAEHSRAQLARKAKRLLLLLKNS